MLGALLDEMEGGDTTQAVEPVRLQPVRTVHPPRAGTSLVAQLHAGVAPMTLDLVDAALADADLTGIDFSGVDLSGANLARANLKGSRLFGSRLRGTILYGAQLDDTDFTGADLRGANLETSRGKHTAFGGATLEDARLAEACLDGATFVGANLQGADLRGAKLAQVRCLGARLVGADATGASWVESDMRDVIVDGATFDHCDLRHAKLAGVRGYESASWIGSDIRDIAPLGVHLWKRFVADQNYLREFRGQSPLSEMLYWLWWATSDCGRSMARWALCTLLLALLFGIAFTCVSLDYGPHATWLSPFYFSVATITTLGYGDVVPASLAAQVVAMMEVTVGYLMLGGLLSILSNKMARRGE